MGFQSPFLLPSRPFFHPLLPFSLLLPCFPFSVLGSSFRWSTDELHPQPLLCLSLLSTGISGVGHDSQPQSSSLESGLTLPLSPGYTDFPVSLTQHERLCLAPLSLGQHRAACRGLARVY